MVSRDPEDMLEALARSLEGEGKVLGAFSNITGKNEGVVWMGDES